MLLAIQIIKLCGFLAAVITGLDITIGEDHLPYMAFARILQVSAVIAEAAFLLLALLESQSWTWALIGFSLAVIATMYKPSRRNPYL